MSMFFKVYLSTKAPQMMSSAQRLMVGPFLQIKSILTAAHFSDQDVIIEQLDFNVSANRSMFPL